MRPSIALLGLITLIGITANCGQAQTAEYLSDIQDRIAQAHQGWGIMGVDTAAYAAGTKAMRLRIKDKSYNKGLGSHAPGDIVVDLDGKYSRFDAEVGVQWQSGQFGSCVFKVIVDDEEVFNSGKMTEQTPAKAVSVSLKGASELVLEATDAGDGINCDVANWADARLTPDPDAKATARDIGVDIARFARVMTWDPARMDGARNNRVQEFAADELFLGTEVNPTANQTHAVPVAANGEACIGLEWLERRRLNEIGIEFASGHVPSSKNARVEYWVMATHGGSPGGSTWQGKWEPLPGKVEERGSRWTYVINWKDNPNRRSGVLKVRWIFPGSVDSIEVRSLSAFSESHWKTVDIVLQMQKPQPGKTAAVMMYNGEILEGNEAVIGRQWKLNEPLELKVRYSTAKRWMTDRTVIRLNLPDGAFGVAVDDVLANGCVYSRDFGFFASSKSAGINLEEYSKGVAKKKTVLDRVREMPDQTFTQAMERVHRPEADLGPTMLSLPCNNSKFVLFRDGVIEFDDEAAKAFESQFYRRYAYSFTPILGSGNRNKTTRRLVKDWLPVPVITVDDSGVSYTQTTYVAPYGRKPDGYKTAEWANDKPLCVVEFHVKNTSSQAADVSAKLQFFDDVEKGKLAELKSIGGCVMAVKGDRPFAAVNASMTQELKYAITDNVCVITGALAPGGDAHFITYIPGWHATSDEISSIQGGKRLLDAAEDQWRRALAEGMQIDIPEPTLKNVIMGSRVHCLLAARNEDYINVAPWIGAINYGPLESEAQSVIRGMEFNGQTDFARRGLDYFLKRVNDKGFLTTGYTVMGTGWMLWSLGEYYSLTRDDAWMKSVASTVAKVCNWAIDQRHKTMKVDGLGNKVPEYGLMPPGVMADWEVYSYYFYLNGYYYAGLNAAGKALEAIRHPDAQKILENAREFRGDILRAFHHAQSGAPLFKLQNGNWVPEYPTHAYCPSSINNFYYGEDFGRSWCYDVELGAHHLVPQGVLDPKSQDVEWMMNHMEDVQFLSDGWFYYPAEGNRKDWFNLGGFAKVQPYYARTVEVYGLRDDVKPFIRSYFNSVISLLNREDLSLWEHFMNGAYNKTHETGYFLYETAMMFVTVRDSQLWIAPFVTNNWMNDGEVVSIRKAPTQYGDVNYTISSHVKDGYIKAIIGEPTRELPKEIVVRLRHPEGKRMKSVTVNGAPHADFDPVKETVVIQSTGGELVVKAQY